MIRERRRVKALNRRAQSGFRSSVGPKVSPYENDRLGCRRGYGHESSPAGKREENSSLRRRMLAGERRRWSLLQDKAMAGERIDPAIGAEPAKPIGRRPSLLSATIGSLMFA